MELTPYKGWPNCGRLSNDIVELIVTTDVGPRIMRFGFTGGANELHEAEQFAGQSGASEWVSYGGHRLWHAPEVMPRTYQPDNAPVTYTLDGKWASFTQPIEQRTGIEKQLHIYLSPDSPHVKLLHRLVNRGLWTVQLSAWPLTVMAGGGKAIFPQEPYAPHPDALAPARPLVLWSYTRMDDPRWTWGARYLQLRHSATVDIPQKLGLLNKQGWAAYWREGRLFVKRFSYIEGATYPDFGCNMESYTDANMVEIETLSPLVSLDPGASVDHTEHWFLYDHVPPAETDDDLDAVLGPLLEDSLRHMSK